MTYINGLIPVEDEGLKRIIVSVDKFIDRVDKHVEFSGVDANKLQTKIHNFIISKHHQSSKWHFSI